MLLKGNGGVLTNTALGKKCSGEKINGLDRAYRIAGTAAGAIGRDQLGKDASAGGGGEDDGVAIALLAAGPTRDTLAVEAGFGKDRLVEPWWSSGIHDESLRGAMLGASATEGAWPFAEIHPGEAKEVGRKNPFGAVATAISAPLAALYKIIFRQAPGRADGQGASTSQE